MGERALPVPVDMAQVENAGFPGGQQLLAGKFRRGMEIAALMAAVGLDQVRCKGVEMGFIAGRDLQGGAIHLQKPPFVEPLAEARHNAVPGQQEGPSVLVPFGRKPGHLQAILAGVGLISGCC